MFEKETAITEILGKLRSMRNPEAIKGMARYGINTNDNYGVSVHKLREMAKEIGTDHELALQLWTSGIHDAKMLASMIDDPKAVTDRQMDMWARDFDSWDVCDQTCNNLFSKTPFAYRKAKEWSTGKGEFVKRAGFVLMANLAVHDKKADNAEFIRFLNIVESGAEDERNYARKAVSWALRQIGKRSPDLNSAATETANRLLSGGSRSERWIASDALKEFRSQKTRRMILRRQKKGGR
ncbi:MAG: DNA alkylation repair protein [Promethearchaeati archaeon SRVP18_Atabeyarchaeia-1]